MSEEHTQTTEMNLGQMVELLDGTNPREILAALPDGVITALMEKFNVPRGTVDRILAGRTQSEEAATERVEPSAPAPMDGPNSNAEFLNFAGKNLGQMLGSIPDLCLGITFDRNGTRVRVSTYLIDDDGTPTPISKKRGASSRFGDVLEATIIDTEACFARIGDDGNVEDDEDEDESEGNGDMSDE